MPEIAAFGLGVLATFAIVMLIIYLIGRFIQWGSAALAIHWENMNELKEEEFILHDHVAHVVATLGEYEGSSWKILRNPFDYYEVTSGGESYLLQGLNQAVELFIKLEEEAAQKQEDVETKTTQGTEAPQDRV